MIFSLWGLNVIILKNIMIKETQNSNKLKQIYPVFRNMWLDSEVLSNAWYLSHVRLRALVGLVRYLCSLWLVGSLLWWSCVCWPFYEKLNTVFPRISAHPLGKISNKRSLPSHINIFNIGIHGKPVSIATLLITVCKLYNGTKVRLITHRKT